MRHEFGRVEMFLVALMSLMTMANSKADAGVLFGRDRQVITTQTPAQFVIVPVATPALTSAAGVTDPVKFFVSSGPVQTSLNPAFSAATFAVEPQALVQAQTIQLGVKFATLRARLAQDATKLAGLITFLNQSKAGGTNHRGALLKLGIEFIAKHALAGIVPTDVIVDLTDLIDELIFGKPTDIATNPTAHSPATISGFFQGQLGNQAVSGQISGTLTLNPPSASGAPPGSPTTTGATAPSPIQEITDSLLGLQTQVQSLHRKVDSLGSTK